MDLNAIAEFVKTYLLDHWPFFVASLLLGTIGQFFKTKVWTKERATRKGFGGHFFWWMQATLALHAPLAGGLLGATMWLTKGSDSALVGPGIAQSSGSVVVYYMASGLLSAWFFAGLRHFVKSRGIDVPDEFEEVEPEHIYFENSKVSADGAVEGQDPPDAA